MLWSVDRALSGCLGLPTESQPSICTFTEPVCTAAQEDGLYFWIHPFASGSIPVSIVPCAHPVIPLFKIPEGRECRSPELTEKGRWAWQPAYNSSTQETQTGIPRASWLARLAQVQYETLPQCVMWKGIRKIPSASYSHVHTCAAAYKRAYIHATMHSQVHMHHPYVHMQKIL